MASPKFDDLLFSRFVNGGRGEKDPDGVGGYDCWGGVMEAFRRFGVDVPDFHEHPDNPLGIGAIFDDQAESGPWERLDEPEIPCLVAMSTSLGHPEAHNHFGVYVGQGKFFHMQRKRGPGLSELDEPPWPRVVRSFWRYVGQAETTEGKPDRLRPQIPEGRAMAVWMPNFVNPRDKVVEFVEPGRTVYAYRPVARDIEAVLDVSGELALAVSLNGERLSPAQERVITVQAGDCLVFKVVPRGGGGDGKNPIATVASIALMVAAPSIGGFMATEMGFAEAFFQMGMEASMAWDVGAAVAGGLVTFGGGALISAVLPPGRGSAPTLGGVTGFEESPTYAWTVEANPTRNGRPIPVLYGERTGVVPMLLTRYIETDGDKQYLNMLFMLAEGELDADGCYDIKIDDNPIENYESVETEFRPGTFDQLPINWFKDTINERPVSVKLTTDWHTVTTEGTAIEGLGLGLSCPSGLGRSDGTLKLATLTLTVEAETRTVGGEWVAFGTFAISGNNRSALRRYFRMNSLDTGQHELRVRLQSAPPSGIEYLSDCYWEYMHEIVPDDFSLPHTAQLALRALATDQLSGSRPRMSCSLKKTHVNVWDPTAEDYVQKAASNPAWMAWDMAHHYRYGGGVPHGRILNDQFEAAADWCDTKGIAGALYLDSPMDIQTAWDHMGQFGRFRVVTSGTKVGCISDRPVAVPEQGLIVTEANVLLGTFGVEYLDTKDRADAIRVTYFDKVKGRTTFLVPGPFYGQITGRAPRVREETLYACDDYDLAWAWAVFRNRCNQYLVETISREMSTEAIGALPGDVIQMGTVFGSQTGRVVTATTGQVQLNCTVMLEPDTSYKLWVKHTDRQSVDTGQEFVENVSVTGVLEETETDTLFISGTLDFAPSEGAVIVFGEPTTTIKWYRILSIPRSGQSKLRRVIKALEYAEEIYEDEGEAPSLESAAVGAAVAGLQAGIFDRIEDGVQKKVVSLFWRGLAVEWQVYYRRPGETPWRLYGVTRDTQVDVYNLEMGYTYEFSVTDKRNPADGEKETVDFGESAMTGMIQQVTVLDATEGVVPVTVEVSGLNEYVQVVM